MGNIIDFKNIKKENVNLSEVKTLLLKLKNDIDEFNEENKDLIDEKFLDLFYQLQLFLSKLNNIKWFTNKKVENFIEKYDSIEKCDDDLFNKYSILLEFIYITSITKGDILDNDIEYVTAMAYSFCEMDDIKISAYPALVESLSNKKLKEIIAKEKTTKSKKLVIEDMIEQLCKGENILEVMMVHEEKEKIPVNELNILTIDNIHSYYLNQAMLLGIDVLSDHVFDNIDSILLLRGYNDIIKNKFIRLVISIRNLEDGVIKELELISDLVDIFTYLSDKIVEYDVDKLESMLFYKNINKAKVESVVEHYKMRDSNEGEMRL